LTGASRKDPRFLGEYFFAIFVTLFSRIFGIIIFESSLLINDFICGSLPFLFWKDFNYDDISLDCTIHILSSDQQNRFGERWYRDATLKLLLAQCSSGVELRFTSK
jgi:hypothetical protein